jgi:hypothetical protein
LKSAMTSCFGLRREARRRETTVERLARDLLDAIARWAGVGRARR